MDIDTDRIDDAVLALLWFHDGARACKSFDWDAMDRLHTKGLIHDPVGKCKRRIKLPQMWRVKIPQTVYLVLSGYGLVSG
jgi:hypothetical protein